MNTPSPKVFVITHEFYPKRGGIATFTEEMARAMARLGHDVEVWAQHAGGVAEPDWPFTIWRLPLKGTHNFGCQLRLAIHLIRRRRELRHAIVYLPEPGPMLTLMLLQRFHAFRPRHLLLTFHGSEILKFYHNPLTRSLTRRLIRNARHVSVLTHYTSGLLCNLFPDASGKVRQTPGALRAGYVTREETTRTTSEPVIVLTVGRLHPRKGQLETLQALRALPAEDRANLAYWIAGSTSRAGYARQLRALANQCDFPVIFHGDLPDEALGDLYDQAHIFAMTSIDYGKSVEGFGLVYLEASAHGLPVVAHAVGGVAEAVADDHTGLLVPPHSPTSLSSALGRLIRDPALREQLGSNGRRWARRHTWEDSARTLLAEDASALVVDA